MTTNNELIDILKGLREYIANEYTLNVDSRSYKGENAKDVPLDASWQQKLEPLSGGTGGEHEGDKGPEPKSTKSGSQGSDPYIHKQEWRGEYSGPSGGKAPGKGTSGGYEAEGLDVQSKAADDMDDMDDMDDVEDVDDMEGDDIIDENGEDMEDDYEEKMGYMKGNMDGESDEVVSLLRDIKSFLEQSSMQKQVIGETAHLREEVSNLVKSLPEMIDGQVNAGIKSGLKSFGYAGSVSDVQKRKSTAKRTGQVTKSASQSRQDTKVERPSVESRIGVQELDGGNAFMKASDVLSDHDVFVSGVEQLASKHDTDDLRGSFKMLNRIREQNGQGFAHNLYYYN